MVQSLEANGSSLSVPSSSSFFLFLFLCSGGEWRETRQTALCYSIYPIPSSPLHCLLSAGLPRWTPVPFLPARCGFLLHPIPPLPNLQQPTQHKEKETATETEEDWVFEIL